MLARLEHAAREAGLTLLGGFAPRPEERAQCDLGAETRALLLFGASGPAFWDRFAASPETSDGDSDPLDRWSRRIGDAMAGRFGAVARFPFGGPPHAPFPRWAARAGEAWPSALGMLIHAERGLWIGYRFALELPVDPGLPVAPPRARPCDSCDGAPCLEACPVDAFGAGGYDVDACVAHLETDAGADCRETGCRARTACPVGRAFRPRPAQAAFHMAAFLEARRRARRPTGSDR